MTARGVSPLGWRRARWLVVLAMPLLISLLGAEAVLADCGNVAAATINGPWQIRTTATSFAGGPPPTFGTQAKVGDQAVDPVTMSTACTGPGHCSVSMQGTINSFQIFDSTGFYFDTTPLVQSGSSYSGVSLVSGFGGPNLPKCSVPHDLERNTLTLTVVAAAPDPGGGWRATQVNGEELVPYGWDCQGSVGVTTGVEHISILAVPAGTAFPSQAIPACAATPAPLPVAKAVASASPAVKPGPPHAANPDQSSLSSSLASPSEALGSPGHTIISGLITLGIILFVTFPAQLFNKTFEDNYDEIRDIMSRKVRWLRRLRSRIGKPGQARRLAIFAAVVLLGAVLGGLNDPEFGLNRRSAASYLAVVVAIIFGVTVSTNVSRIYRRVRKRDLAAHLHALPAGLVVAGVCVLISRLSTFQPGYVYGVICGVAFSKKLPKHEEGHNVVLAAVAALSLAVVAWLVWIPANTAAHQPDAGFAALVAATFLSAVFVGGLVGQVIGLLPLNFLPGGTLKAWSRLAWVGTFGIAVFGLVEVMLRPESTSAHPGNAPLVTGIVLFVLFGGLSVGFWSFFALRHRRQKRAATALVQTLLTAPKVQPRSHHRQPGARITQAGSTNGGNGEHATGTAPMPKELAGPPQP